MKPPPWEYAHEGEMRITRNNLHEFPHHPTRNPPDTRRQPRNQNTKRTSNTDNHIQHTTRQRWRLYTTSKLHMRSTTSIRLQNLPQRILGQLLQLLVPRRKQQLLVRFPTTRSMHAGCQPRLRNPRLLPAQRLPDLLGGRCVLAHALLGSVRGSWMPQWGSVLHQELVKYRITRNFFYIKLIYRPYLE